MAMGRWGQEMWLSDRDFLDGVKCAVLVENVSFAELNLMSGNPGMRWDMEETKDTIGFVPQDGHKAKMNFSLRTQARLKKFIVFTLPRWIERWIPNW
tara:strand:+ start:169 stop:459 length:291 start_codon:yes stop_codon:yes gene_type:complete